MCFTSSWELTLILLLIFPFVLISQRLTHNLLYSSGSGSIEFLEVSTHVVTETVSNIKTVITHGADEYFVNTIGCYLQSHMMYVVIIV